MSIGPSTYKPRTTTPISSSTAPAPFNTHAPAVETAQAPRIRENPQKTTYSHRYTVDSLTGLPQNDITIPHPRRPRNADIARISRNDPMDSRKT